MSRLSREMRRNAACCFMGQLLRVWLVAAALLPIPALLLALADWAFVLSADTRFCLLWVLGGVACLGGIWGVVSAWRVAARLPQEFDALNADPRCAISGALSLPTPARGGGLSAWLTQRARQEALSAVETAAEHRPALKRLGKGGLWLLCSVLALIALQTSCPVAFKVLGMRLLYPYEDVPPYSPYTFRISPEVLEVNYGEALEVACTIEGEPPPGEIVLRLRADGVPEQSLPVVCDAEGRYSRMLENVTTPCSIAFYTADGRAGSRFVPVHVKRLPRILSGRAQLIPLPYTGLAPREVRLGGSEIGVPDGGSVRFTLRCNLPLQRAQALFTPADGSAAEPIAGTVAADTAHFEMTVRRSGTLEMQVYDANGSAADAPVRTRLAPVPDAAPQVQIRQPQNGSYVVEGYPLQLHAEAADDYGVSRFELFKALAPYRQHGVKEDCSARATERTIKQTFHTADLGVKAGDKLEFRAEAGDDNPFRFHIVSSATATVTVISPAEYAEILRLELSYLGFKARYNQLKSVLEANDRALEALAAATTPEARAAALQQVLAANKKAQELAASVARDFPAFAMDSSLSALAARLAEKLAAEQQALSQLSLQLPQQDWAAAVQAVQRARLAEQQELVRQDAEAQKVKCLAELQAIVNRISQLAEQQKQLSELMRRFKTEFGSPITTQPAKLEGLGADQSLLLEDWRVLMQQAHALQQEMAPDADLAKASAFLTALLQAADELGIETLMQQAVHYASEHHSAETESHARRAAEALQRLLQARANAEACSNACKACQNCLSQSACQALSQLCDGMCRSSSGGNKPGPGKGMASGGYAGFGTPGGSPGRMSGRVVGSGRADYSGHADTAHGKPVPSAGTASGPNQPFHPSADTPGAPPAPDAVNLPANYTEQVPTRYLDAVRSYFNRS